MTDLFLNKHVLFDTWPYLQNQRFGINICSTNSYVYNVIYNLHYYKNFHLFVFVSYILTILRYILSIYAKILQPFDMHGFPVR